MENDLVKAQSFADKILKITHKLVVGPNKAGTLFARIIEGVFRRDYLTLYTVHHLSQTREDERVVFGNSCMDLSRRVLEDLICVEYILMKGKDESSKKFADFKSVEAKRDLDYLKDAGLMIDKALEEVTNREYDSIKKRFTDSKGNVRKSWAGLDTESMIKELLDKKIIREDEKRTLIQAYLIGNSKNHFSPSDIFNHLYQDLFNFNNQSDLVLSLISITCSVTRLAVIFGEEYDIDPEIKNSIQKTWDELLVAHLTK
jgi:hypothetical protein